MTNQFSTEPMLDMYLFETSQNIEQLEASILSSEKTSTYTQDAVNEIFRIMHTIKGSSAMMLFQNVSQLAHSVEDIFFHLRENKDTQINFERLTDTVLESIDFIKCEIEKIRAGRNTDGNPDQLIIQNQKFLEELRQTHPGTQTNSSNSQLKDQKYYIKPEKAEAKADVQTYKAIIKFEDGCEMENIRAYTVIHSLKDVTSELFYFPEDIIDNDGSIQVIREQGFTIYFKSSEPQQMLYDLINQTLFLRELDFEKLEDTASLSALQPKQKEVEVKPIKPIFTSEKIPEVKEEFHTQSQSIISVSVSKLDMLMDLVGEMVIAEAMVTQNPEFLKLGIESFQKASRQLHKITNDIQNMVMSIRMVPLSMTFLKMERVVRDMSKKLQKEASLEIIGEDTEVDKNIIEHISDPLMHLVRNAIDHGIESPSERLKNGKTEKGCVTLEAKNAGSDVLIIVKDNGRGLSREKILQKAKSKNLLTKPGNEMTDKEVYALILQPGFSTKEEISEYSGRGVGMDVVTKNLEAIGGSVFIDSTEGAGTVITMKIPLTLAIIDGMNVRVGQSRFTIPTNTIQESFRPKPRDLITDPDNREMIMVRGQCYPIIRLHERYEVKTGITTFDEGILIMVEQDERSLCLFADELLGQQQVVVKALPNYIKNNHKIKGLAGCTLLGDGGISLILDVGALFN